MTSRLNPAKQSTKNMRKIRKKKGMPLKKVVDPRDAVASKGLMQENLTMQDDLPHKVKIKKSLLILF